MKNLIRRLLRRRGWELRWAGPEFDAEAAIQSYEAGGRIPWSRGYQQAKFRFIARTLDDPATLALFRNGQSLPLGFGLAFDERCVEYPWAFAQIGDSDKRILDAGSTFNFPEIIERPIMANRELHILTLGPEESCFWQRRISYLFSDLRELPYRDGYFDLVACISTLEHVGLDNSAYAGASFKEQAARDYLKAIGEMRRVVKPGGKLLITVPFGRYANHGLFQQFDTAMIEQIVALHPGAQSTFFRYTSAGWERATVGDCQEATFSTAAVRQWTHRDSVWPAGENQASAGAVACLSFPATRST